VNELIVRIAARGDGVTASGRHVPWGVPGDALLDDGALAFGPHHQAPPCRHFPECGGCQLQHTDDEAYRDYLVSRVKTALAQHGLEAEIGFPHLCPPKTRRRATLRALKAGGRVLIGFNAAGSNRIVDMHECHILHPCLFALLEPLRELLAPILPPRRVAELQMTLAANGLDLTLKGLEVSGLDAIEALTAFGEANRLARLSLDEGMGPEPRYEPEPVFVIFGGVRVALPIGAFLQATADGEATLVWAVREATKESKRIADLFAGLGTFALASGAAYAAEASRDATTALKRAAPAMTVEHRDLYRRPLDALELKSLDAVILDPPRAGAEEQVRQLAASTVARIAYVSCNPATFARDAEILMSGGYRLESVQPVGQFRWSTHVELASCFSRGQ